MTTDAATAITAGRTALGIELGSTRIKAVLIGPDHAPLAVGSHDWENQLVDRLWTYSLDTVWSGLQRSVAALAEDVRRRHGVELAGVGALGVSAMMHGYLAFDADGGLLTPFRTWRNTNTGRAVERLSAELGQNIPHRWSVAHLYQAVLDGEEHVGRIDHLTTLAGYVHWQLTGRKVLGIGDASGMFPIAAGTAGYDTAMLARFDQLAAEAGAELELAALLPAVAVAGEPAGTLTEAGARLLDPTGWLQPGVPLCPPEGDAGTGMVATNSVAPRTGNVSAGTSIFAMVVLERELSRAHRELDLVTTPAGDPVAMVHCNNGASELDAWAGLFGQFARALGAEADSATVFRTLFTAALDGAGDGGGMLAYNYLSGEPITKLEEGRPLFLRSPDSPLDLGSFMRTHLYSSLATLRIGMDVLQKAEGVRLDRMFAHGGLFKTEGVAQRFLAAAIDTPVSVGDVAAEGGAWGIAVLAAFAAGRSPEQGLADYLDGTVFTDASLQTAEPDPADVAGFDAFMQRYLAGLPVERAAVEHVAVGAPTTPESQEQPA
ncbi:Carbohydrate kinase, FGGY-domain [Modestobacter italicus]|uniref:Carbohydrate kinase, FGGY-domain n=1 Tax=Modestobacter italicus (strain DSM 44449 / CECT 9708 / BC 501) TaxID=2732864 RepID=I4EQQ0_MODI5|nr:FGGY-family carbohydrate kinase [Modestobacter marinus]CCH85713.1 Carbohydrate kinase, FGGY-domain [Modestobacter marinus]